MQERILCFFSPEKDLRVQNADTNWKNGSSMVDTYWESVVKILTFAFQPIIDLRSKRIFGYEALLRNYEKAGFSSIHEFFDASFQKKTLYGVDLLLREKVISLFVQLPHYTIRRLFYNIDNRILEMPDFEPGNTLKILKKFNIPNSAMIFEISERMPFQSYENLSKIIFNYKNQGFKIAIDDYGTGYSSLKLLYSTEPDILKIDHFFIKNITNDLRKRIFVEEVVRFIHLIGGIAIAEGIETEEELYTCYDLGIDLVQGYFISPPFMIEEHSKYLHNIRSVLKKIQSKYFPFSYTDQKENTLDTIKIEPIPPIKINCDLDDILLHIQKFPEYSYFPVVNEHYEPEGILYEKDVKKYYLSRYVDKNSRDVEKVTVEQFTRKTYILDHKTDILYFFEMIYNNDDTLFNGKSFTEIIITQNGVYQGVISSESVLKYIFKKMILTARESNPLTHLPGNISVKKYIQNNQKFTGTLTILYLDINYFKPFNDEFGFEKGDQIILYLAKLLKHYFQDKHLHFIGHIGGDDFVVIVKNRNLFHSLKLFLHIQKDFLRYVTELIPGNSILEGKFYFAKNRYGITQKIPLPGISCGILHFEKTKELPLDDLTYLVAEVKNAAKTAKKNVAYKIL